MPNAIDVLVLWTEVHPTSCCTFHRESWQGPWFIKIKSNSGRSWFQMMEDASCWSHVPIHKCDVHKTSISHRISVINFVTASWSSSRTVQGQCTHSHQHFMYVASTTNSYTTNPLPSWSNRTSFERTGESPSLQQSWDACKRCTFRCLPKMQSPLHPTIKRERVLLQQIVHAIHNSLGSKLHSFASGRPAVFYYTTKESAYDVAFDRYNFVFPKKAIEQCDLTETLTTSMDALNSVSCLLLFPSPRGIRYR